MEAREYIFLHPASSGHLALKSQRVKCSSAGCHGVALFASRWPQHPGSAGVQALLRRPAQVTLLWLAQVFKFKKSQCYEMTI